MIMMSVKILFIAVAIFANTKAEEGPKIVGGQEAIQGQFPYQVSLCYDVKVGANTYCNTICGGSIYDKDTIITSAQCCEIINDEKDYKIVAGELDTYSESGLEQIIEINKYNHIIHPDFNSTTLENDVCKLMLNSSLNITKDQVEGIELNTEDPIFGSQCIVSGWGAVMEGGVQPNILQYMIQTISTNSSCYQKWYNNTGATDVYNENTMFCAAEKAADTCIGDMGGPFVCAGKLTGIASYGNNCSDFSGVYTNVKAFEEWLKNPDTTERPATTPSGSIMTVMSLLSLTFAMLSTLNL